MRRFFMKTDQIRTTRPVITGADARHIIRVLRLGIGDRLVLFDGTGAEFESQIVALAVDRVELSIVRSFSFSREPAIRLTVAQAFLKDKKMDGLIRQMTELGATRWIPFFALRSVARPAGTRIAGRIDRWEKIAGEALKQCGRSRPPEIDPVRDFDDMLIQAAGSDVRLFFWEKEGDPLTRAAGTRGTDATAVFLVLGPEGGFEAEEADRARRAGFRITGLGPRILRAETAPVAACALVQYLFGDWAPADTARS